MIREGANPNILLKRKGGLSPFHLSVGLPGPKAIDIVAILLDGNANPNLRTQDGLTPLHIAGKYAERSARRNHDSMVTWSADLLLCVSHTCMLFKIHEYDKQKRKYTEHKT